MRLFFTLVLLFCTSYLFAQPSLTSDKVSLKVFPGNEIKAGQPLTLEITASEAEEVEVAIFQNNFLGYQANASLQAGQIKYEIQTSGWPSGKYYLLIKNKDIHIQEEITLTD